MYVVVAGAGTVGRAIARALRTEGHDVVVLDREPEALEAVRRLDVMTVLGGAASPDALKKAAVQKADLFYGVTSDDEANLLACAMVKARNKDCRTVARVNALDYMRDLAGENFHAIGCDAIVCPELVAAQRIARLVDAPGVLDADTFAGGRVQVVERRVVPGSRLAGFKVKDLALPRDCKLVAILRDEEVFVPGPSDTLKADDRLLAVAPDATAVRQLQQLLGDGAPEPAPRPVRRVLLVGGSRAGVHLARVLAGPKEVTILERDRARCQALTEQLPEVMVLQGDAADREVLEEEGIESVDALVACEDRDEFNILTCLLAKQLGVRKVISLVRQASLKNLAERIGIDLAVSPRQASVGEFLRHAHEHTPVKLSLLAQGEAQIVEFEVGPKSRLVGEKVRKAGFPKNSVVAAIARGAQAIVPSGDEYIQAGDVLVVFALTDVAPKLHRLL